MSPHRALSCCSLVIIALAGQPPIASAQVDPFTAFVDERLDLAQSALAMCDQSTAGEPRPTEPVRVVISYSVRRISVSTSSVNVSAGWRRCIEEAITSVLPVSAANARGVPRRAAQVAVSIALGTPSVAQ